MKCIKPDISTIHLWCKKLGKERIVQTLPQNIVRQTKLSYCPEADIFIQNTNHKALSYSKRTGLRSFQHITGDERDIINIYKNELTHDVWGNPDKMKEWTLLKIDELANKSYPSDLLDDLSVAVGRNNLVKEWYNLIKSDYFTNDKPFLQLKIMKFVTNDLLIDNKSMAPFINRKVFSDAAYECQKHGKSFKKVYYSMIRSFDNSIRGVSVEEFGIQGKWFTVNIPNACTANKNVGLFNEIKEFISVLSQGSNWCTRNYKSIENFTGTIMHIFVDNKGVPQLCLTSFVGKDDAFKYVKGKDQYAPIPEKYLKILKSYIKKHGFNDVHYGEKT